MQIHAIPYQCQTKTIPISQQYPTNNTLPTTIPIPYQYLTNTLPIHTWYIYHHVTCHDTQTRRFINDIKAGSSRSENKAPGESTTSMILYDVSVRICCFKLLHQRLDKDHPGHMANLQGLPLQSLRSHPAEAPQPGSSSDMYSNIF